MARRGANRERAAGGLWIVWPRRRPSFRHERGRDLESIRIIRYFQADLLEIIRAELAFGHAAPTRNSGEVLAVVANGDAGDVHRRSADAPFSGRREDRVGERALVKPQPGAAAS